MTRPDASYIWALVIESMIERCGEVLARRQVAGE